MKRQNRSRFQKSRQPDRNPLEALFSIGGITNLLSSLMISVMLKDIAANLVTALQQAIGKQGIETQPIDEDYATRFACALYYVCICVPFQVMRDELGGPINVAWNCLHSNADECSPAAVLKMLQEGFSEISPTIATAVTEEIIIKTGKLMLWDWIHVSGEPTDGEVFDYDCQFYFHELIQAESSPDEDAILREGYTHIMNMSEEERAQYDPSLFEHVQEWAKREGIDKAE